MPGAKAANSPGMQASSREASASDNRSTTKSELRRPERKGGGGVHVPFKTCSHSIAVCIAQGRMGAGILAHYVSIYMMHSMHLHQVQ